MSSESDRRQGNAFTIDFLQRMDEIGEPDGAHEADVDGPWAVRPVLYRGGTGFGVLREWESLEAGDAPYAVFGRREMALLAAAVLPATGRELVFRLETEPDAQGFPVIAAMTPRGAAPAGSRAAAGHLRDFDEGLAFALHLAAAIVRSPVALAWLLEAAGHVALEQAGRILDHRVHRVR